MIVRVKADKQGIARLAETSEVGNLMRPTAETILARAQPKAPPWLQADWFVKAGQGPRGSFAQAIARGDGAIIAEYGGRWSEPFAMFRSSL